MDRNDEGSYELVVITKPIVRDVGTHTPVRPYNFLTGITRYVFLRPGMATADHTGTFVRFSCERPGSFTGKNAHPGTFPSTLGAHTPVRSYWLFVMITGRYFAYSINQRALSSVTGVPRSEETAPS